MSLGLDNELQMQLQISSDYFQPRLIFYLCFISHDMTVMFRLPNVPLKMMKKCFLNRERENP